MLIMLLLITLLIFGFRLGFKVGKKNAREMTIGEPKTNPLPYMLGAVGAYFAVILWVCIVAVIKL